MDLLSKRRTTSFGHDGSEHAGQDVSPAMGPDGSVNMGTRVMMSAAELSLLCRSRRVREEAILAHLTKRMKSEPSSVEV